MTAPVPKTELLDDIQRVAEELGHAPTESEYKENGDYSPSTARNKYGTFRAAREQAGCRSVDRRGGQNRISREQLLNGLWELYMALGRVPTRDEMNDRGAYSGSAYRRAFGSWNEALDAAGMDRNHEFNLERQEYECDHCGTSVHRLPSTVATQDHIFCSRSCNGKFYAGERHPMYDRCVVPCDTCGALLERKPSVVDKKEYLFCDKDCYSTWCEQRTGEQHPRWKGGGKLYYGPNWHSQRRLCLERDGFQCVDCGMTQEEHHAEYGRQLIVHHRVPVRQFYRQTTHDEPDWEEVNALSNLVTVCHVCHSKWERLPVQPRA